MAIKPNFSRREIESYLARKRLLIERAIISRLKLLGEKCVAEARSLNTYMDQSGNLRSSIGYVIVKNGAIIHSSSFEQVQPWSSSDDAALNGGEVGEKYAKKLGLEHSSGYALVVVAGMSYASYVEAMGKDVLSSAEHLAERELPKMLRQLQANIRKSK